MNHSLNNNNSHGCYSNYKLELMKHHQCNMVFAQCFSNNFYSGHKTQFFILEQRLQNIIVY